MDAPVQDRTQEEKRMALFLRQKQMLDAFLQRGAITRAEYDKSLNGLRDKMGIKEE